MLHKCFRTALTLYDNFCRSKRKHFHFLDNKVKQNVSVGFYRLKNKNCSLSVKCINPYLSDISPQKQ